MDRHVSIHPSAPRSTHAQVLPATRDDACQLACLAAELRLATLVDTATGGAAAAPQVHAVLRNLYERLMEVGPALVSRAAAGAASSSAGGSAAADGPAAGDGGAEAAAIYLAWLLDALQSAVAYIASTGAHQACLVFGALCLHAAAASDAVAACWEAAHRPSPVQPTSQPIHCLPQVESAAVLAALPSRLVTLLARAVSKGVFAFAAPALGALRNLDTASLRPEELAALVPALATCQQRPGLAAAVAEVAPALARCPSPHAEVLQVALSSHSPLLQHLGMEAFRQYAQACPAAALTKALPPSMLNPGGWWWVGGW